LAAFVAGSTAFGQAKWVTVKGEVKLAAAPAVAAINVTADKEHCLSKGPLNSDEVVVGKKGGLKNVVVYLRPDDTNRNAVFKPADINPDLAKAKPKDHVIDQPCCQFVPRITVARVGDSLTVKNSAPVNHNFKYESDNNGSANWNTPPGQSQKFKDPLKAEARPIPFECNVHPWMKGQVRVFDHPYFALTDEDGKFEIKDAPAGKFRIVYHHEKGYHKGAAGRLGEVVQIAPGADGKTMEMKPIDYEFPK
jgi:plastocyanin